MAYIGNTAENQAFTPAVDFFNGDGVTTAFTLSRPVASVAQVQATIENVPQNPGTAFTVSGNTITFTSAPPSGTGNIYVYYTSPITTVIQPSQGTVGLTQLSATGTPSAATFLRGDNTWGAAGGFDSGTKMMFVQTAAPTGWTKDTTHNNKALRVVSGTASSGGSVAFTTAFASQAVAGTVGTSGATTLSTSEIPSHSHSLPGTIQLYGAPSLGSGVLTQISVQNTGAAGGGGSHTHGGGTFTGTAINLAVQYVDVIIATKD